MIISLLILAFVVGCGENEPASDYAHLLGRYSYGIIPEEGWGPAISLPGGLVELHLVTPDSLILWWDVSPTTPLPGTPRVVHFVDGAYRLTVPGQPWTVDYRFWPEAEGVRCEGDVSPAITESTYCRLIRLGDLEESEGK